MVRDYVLFGRQMRVWDAFCYNGELEALHTRLAMPGIDRRVLVEARMTHSGQKKEALYYQWQLPDVTLITPDLSQYTDCWARENGQRNAIMDGLTDADDEDIVMVSDADEIPFTEGISRARRALRQHPAVVLCQTMYNYDRRWVDPKGWRGTIVTTYGHLKQHSPQTLRDQRETLPRIPDAGEHLSWFGGAGEVSRKLSSFAHTEYSGLAADGDTIRDRISTGEDLFGRWSLENLGTSRGLAYDQQDRRQHH